LKFLTDICNHFIKPEVLRNISNNFDFSNKENQNSLNEIYLGEDCEKYLHELITEGHTDIVAIIRENCLQFLETAAQEICKKLPIYDKFLSKLKVFEPNIALSDINRESSFNDVVFVVQIFGGFDDNELRKEWFALHQGFTEEEKNELLRSDFDEMWKKIFKHNHEYHNLKSLLNTVRSLPNSNANAERIFSILLDLKTKKRNKLSFVTVNASCVLKSALKARKKTAINIEINENHFSLMSTNKLYSVCSKKSKSHITFYANVYEIVDPSSFNDVQ